MNFRITASPSISQTLLPRVCHILTERYPHLHLTVGAYSTRRATELVAENEFDMALSSIIVPNRIVLSTPLFNEDYRLLCARSGHQNNKDVVLADLNPGRQLFINWDTDNYVWENGYVGENARSPIECRTVDGLSYYLKEMGMWCIAPVSYAEYMKESFGLAVHNIIGNVPPRTTYVFRHIHNSNPLIEEIVGLLKEEVNGLNGFHLLP